MSLIDNYFLLYHGMKRANIMASTLYRVEDREYFYFVHSYHVICKDKNKISSVTDYGTRIVSSIEHENIYAFQFH